jgi:hypothetical protein
MNAENTCERDVCECDKYFSETVATFQFEWQEEHHLIRGISKEIDLAVLNRQAVSLTKLF